MKLNTNRTNHAHLFNISRVSQFKKFETSVADFIRKQDHVALYHQPVTIDATHFMTPEACK